MLDSRPNAGLLKNCFFWIALVATLATGWSWTQGLPPLSVCTSFSSADGPTPLRTTSRLTGKPAQNPGTPPFVMPVHLVLKTHCLICHDNRSKKGGLDLSNRQALLRGGDSGPAVVPGDAKASLLYKLITHEREPVMPYKADKLPEEVIARVADWINAGAPFDQLSAVSAVNQSEGQAEGKSASRLFVEQVRPVLETQCLVCHGGKFKQAGLNISTRELLLRGSDNGAVIVLGSAQDSLLVKKIKHEHQPGMPYQRKKLSEDTIAQIVQWINEGAPYDEPLKISTSVEQVISQNNRLNHWAFKTPTRVTLPVVNNQAWVLNPIDTFIASEHEKRGLKPLPSVDKRVLLRRVCLDLTGLPPTPDEVHSCPITL